MITTTDKISCCGCTACETVCSVHKAINMQPDGQGFAYPVVNTDKCVNCGLCIKVCPFIQKNKNFPEYQKIYGARLKNIEGRFQSQSGGAFQALAMDFIERGGFVYGVTIDKNLTVKHCRITDMADLSKLFGSKYVQSNMDNIYASVINDLKKGNAVLFSGVGCQVSGLINLCRTKRVDTSRLLTVDLICYGVPSPRYWKDYTDSIHRVYKSPIKDYKFRNKELSGWKNSGSSFTLNDGRSIVPMRNFYNTLLFRRSCSACPYTSFDRVSDITVGDFWGIENVKPDWAAEDNGVSLIIVSSRKGADAFRSANNRMEYFETDREHSRQPQLTSPNPLHPLKDEWERDYQKLGFEAAARKFNIIFAPTTLKRLQLRIKHIVNRLLSIIK